MIPAPKDAVDEIARLFSEVSRLRTAISWQEATIAARDARIAELEEALRDLYGLTIEMETLYTAGWQDIDEYVSGMEKARAALGNAPGGDHHVHVVLGDKALTRCDVGLPHRNDGLGGKALKKW